MSSLLLSHVGQGTIHPWVSTTRRCFENEVAAPRFYFNNINKKPLKNRKGQYNTEEVRACVGDKFL